MSILRPLEKRSNSQCELCSSQENLSVFTIPDIKENGLESALLTCTICADQMQNTDNIDANHWRCLNDSMWSEHDAVKIMVWRMLNRIKADWPQDLLNMMYLEDATLELAKASGDGEDEVDKIIHKDVNGVTLQTGDSVVLIKDLKVKGSSMIAKQGTAVRNIRLDHENASYIEGRVDSQHIVIITEYVKKL